jgi:tripartite-type tricarboxylate transporter receptor subunit TctC
VQSGQLRVLATLDVERSRIYPDTPTAGELGYKVGAPAWSGFYAPAGVPEERLALLEHAFKTAFDTPEFQNLCVERGMQPAFMDRRQFREFASQQAELFARDIPELLRLER